MSDEEHISLHSETVSPDAKLTDVVDAAVRAAERKTGKRLAVTSVWRGDTCIFRRGDK